MTNLPQAKGSQHLELDPLWNDNSQRLHLPPNVPRPASHDLQVDFEKQTPTNVVVKASNGKFRVILKLQNGLGILKRFKNLN